MFRILVFVISLIIAFEFAYFAWIIILYQFYQNQQTSQLSKLSDYFDYFRKKYMVCQKSMQKLGGDIENISRNHNHIGKHPKCHQSSTLRDLETYNQGKDTIEKVILSMLVHNKII